MKTTVIILLVLLTGCANMTHGQKTAIGIGAAVLVAGAIAAHNDTNGSSAAICPPNAFDCRPVK